MTNNNYSPLPFYDEPLVSYYGSQPEMQSAKEYAYGRIFDLVAPLGLILPFQILTDAIDGAAVTASLSVLGQEGSVVDLSPNLEVISITDDSGQDTGRVCIAYAPGSSTIPGQTLGRHQLTITYGGKTFYSDIFTWVNPRITKLLSIYWWDLQDIKCEPSVILYNSYSGAKFVNQLYIQTEVGKPTYNFEEEGESRDGLFYPYKQVSEKQYKCTFLAPEYMCDILRVIRMSDRIHIYDYLDRHYKVDRLEFDIDWQDQGDLAAVTLTFETDTIIKKTNWFTKGDYNGDFNDDFDRYIP